MTRKMHPNSLANLIPNNRLSLTPKQKITLTLTPETIALLKRTGNASQLVERLVEAVREGKVKWSDLGY